MEWRRLVQRLARRTPEIRVEELTRVGVHISAIDLHGEEVHVFRTMAEPLRVEAARAVEAAELGGS